MDTPKDGHTPLARHTPAPCCERAGAGGAQRRRARDALRCARGAGRASGAERRDGGGGGGREQGGGAPAPGGRAAARHLPRIQREEVRRRGLPPAGDGLLAVLHRAGGRSGDDHVRPEPLGEPAGEPGGAGGDTQRHGYAHSAAVRAGPQAHAALWPGGVRRRRRGRERGGGDARGRRAAAAGSGRRGGRFARALHHRSGQRGRRLQAAGRRRGQRHRPRRAVGDGAPARPRGARRVLAHRAGGGWPRHRPRRHQGARCRAGRERQQPRVHQESVPFLAGRPTRPRQRVRVRVAPLRAHRRGDGARRRRRQGGVPPGGAQQPGGDRAADG